MLKEEYPLLGCLEVFLIKSAIIESPLKVGPCPILRGSAEAELTINEDPNFLVSKRVGKIHEFSRVLDSFYLLDFILSSDSNIFNEIIYFLV